MISLKKNNKGFTIVELLIVIVVIGILALLVVTAYSGVQAKARNSTRVGNLASIQTQLELFFTANGYYPSLADMNSTAWLAANMKGLPEKTLIDPSNASKSPLLVNPAAAKSYSYVVTDASGASCETTDTNCAQYILTATYEGTYNGDASDILKNLG